MQLLSTSTSFSALDYMDERFLLLTGPSAWVISCLVDTEWNSRCCCFNQDLKNLWALFWCDSISRLSLKLLSQFKLSKLLKCHHWHCLNSRCLEHTSYKKICFKLGIAWYFTIELMQYPATSVHQRAPSLSSATSVHQRAPSLSSGFWGLLQKLLRTDKGSKEAKASGCLASGLCK